MNGLDSRASRSAKGDLQADGGSRWGLSHARFKGVLRRLAVPNAEEYDEEEYTEAIEAFFLATKKFSAHSRCGMQPPFA